MCVFTPKLFSEVTLGSRMTKGGVKLNFYFKYFCGVWIFFIRNISLVIEKRERKRERKRREKEEKTNG